MRRDVVERIMATVDIREDGCWIWTASLDRSGYGRFFFSSPTRLAHRASYELLVGPIPDGLEIDHLCRVRCCVNPAHLEPVTAKENNRRKELALGIGVFATHCKHGHEFTPENTYFGPTHKAAKPLSQHRCCRTCNAAAQRRYKLRCASSVLDNKWRVTA
jgi:hypothetical protein